MFKDYFIQFIGYGLAFALVGGLIITFIPSPAFKVVVVIIIVFILSYIIYKEAIEEQSRKYEIKMKELDDSKKSLENDKKDFEQYKEEMVSGIHKTAEEKAVGFPWLAQAYADYFHLQDLKKANYLEHKKRPAQKAAEHLKEVASDRRVVEKLYRVLRYQLNYYENLFPWLVEFKDEDIDDLVRQLLEEKQEKGALEEPDDPAKKWLTVSEYKNFPQADKYQLALERYWKKKKTKWEIGRDYERYNGYLYEKAGYSVFYQGIQEGLADLGRDLIAKKGDNVEIVQCKHWSREKTIHEKHIFQLFGTTVEYYLKSTESTDTIKPSLFAGLLREERIKGTFVTSTKLSEKARKFAETLGIKVKENFPLQTYPIIKCNISLRTNEKIYHLPFDQQYDRTVIDGERNECYVKTVIEAEKLGFRRAFRWRGERENESPL